MTDTCKIREYNADDCVSWWLDHLLEMHCKGEEQVSMGRVPISTQAHFSYSVGFLGGILGFAVNGSLGRLDLFDVRDGSTVKLNEGNPAVKEERTITVWCDSNSYCVKKHKGDFTLPDNVSESVSRSLMLWQKKEMATIEIGDERIHIPQGQGRRVYNSIIKALEEAKVGS